MFVSSAHVSRQFGFDQLLDDIKTGLETSRSTAVIGRADELEGTRC